ncbi:hypothetical protein [Phreatobacter sp.]|uniref:hypothetical protein n=1 Tax=Phreatobacter sp. TaxID=1966341 RepID=UPI003F715504
MDVSPLVSAYRYRFHVLDAHGARVGGLARPAATIEEALKRAAADLKLVNDPPNALKALASRTNQETRNALRDVIARAENDLAIAITRFGTEIGAPAIGPHIELRATLDGLDRSYRAAEPGPFDFEGWFDYLDAQIAHLTALSDIEKDLDAARRGGVAPLQVPDSSPRRLRWVLVALAGSAVVALGIAAMLTLNGPGDATRSTAQPGPETPRVVRTVPITVPPLEQQPAAPAPAAPPQQQAAVQPGCRTFEIEVGGEGADLIDAPVGGQPVVRLEPGEKLVLRQVIDFGPNRLVEVEVPGRSARGFVNEREARLPVMTWTCDR